MEELSQCCSASVSEDFKGNDNNTPLIEIYTCNECNQECDVYEDKPEYHLGEKEVEDNRVDEAPEDE